MGQPTVAAIKRLFAISGNVCAFPRCNTPLVDTNSGKVTGRICHIRSRNEKGPRYNSGQTEEERHGFDNLILMCPIHHDVIDDDPDSYTVERLQKIKVDHESGAAAQPEPADDVAEQFLASIEGNVVTQGSIIFTQSQMGGQVAHSITNVGPQPRRISKAAANALIAELRKHPPETIDITSLMGDAESHNLAMILQEVLKSANWQSAGVSQVLYAPNIPRGVIVETPVAKTSLSILLNWLGQVGLNPEGHQIPEGQGIKLIVGANL